VLPLLLLISKVTAQTPPHPSAQACTEVEAVAAVAAEEEEVAVAEAVAAQAMALQLRTLAPPMGAPAHSSTGPLPTAQQLA
jgi:hypothetical protein